MSTLKTFNIQINMKTCYRNSRIKKLFLLLILIESRLLIKNLWSNLRLHHFITYFQVHRFQTHQICYFFNHADSLTISSRRYRNLKYVTKTLSHFLSHLAYDAKRLIFSKHNILHCERFFIYLNLIFCFNDFY